MQISYLHTATRSICKRLGKAWLCPTVAFIAFASTIGACSWGPETACRKPTLSGTKAVALRLVGTGQVELVVSNGERTSTHEGNRTVAFLHIRRPIWHSHHLKDDGVIYFWIGYEYPNWIKTSNGEPIGPVQCRLGEYVASLIVTDGDVTLVQDGRETKLEAPEPSGISGYVTVFE